MEHGYLAGQCSIRADLNVGCQLIAASHVSPLVCFKFSRGERKLERNKSPARPSVCLGWGAFVCSNNLRTDALANLFSLSSAPLPCQVQKGTIGIWRVILAEAGALEDGQREESRLLCSGGYGVGSWLGVYCTRHWRTGRNGPIRCSLLIAQSAGGMRCTRLMNSLMYPVPP